MELNFNEYQFKQWASISEHLSTHYKAPKLIGEITEELIKGYSYADAFAEEYITRFQEDIDIIRFKQHLLDFVTSDTITWFENEVEALEQLVRSTPSFQHNAIDVVHNDMNWENVLVDNNNDCWIIDWDDLTVSGDAAMDYFVLLWPQYQEQEWPYWSELVVKLAGNELFERLQYYFRAKL